MAVYGVCKLCLKRGELRDSHLLPRAFYRLLRDRSAAGKRANPIFVAKEGAAHSQTQVHHYLLCPDCEDRFSRNGETYVLGNCYRENDGFLLRDALLAQTPIANLASFNVDVIDGIAAIGAANLDKLGYFVASVFWRGTVDRWFHDGRELNLPWLGKKFTEEFRQYLLGNGGFPAEAVLNITVSRSAQPWNFCATPYGGRRDGYRQYRFPIPGIGFSLLLGKEVPAGMRRICAMHSPGRVIFVGDTAEQRIMADMLPELLLRALQDSRSSAALHPRAHSGIISGFVLPEAAA